MLEENVKNAKRDENIRIEADIKKGRRRRRTYRTLSVREKEKDRKRKTRSMLRKRTPQYAIYSRTHTHSNFLVNIRNECEMEE